MPMPNNEFKWRPNDNSVTTLLRYELEAEKWVNAVNRAQRRAQPRSFSKDFAFISNLIQLIFCVILLILLGVLMLLQACLKWIRLRTEKGKAENEERIGLMPNEAVLGSLAPPEEKREYYYRKGGSFFQNEFGELRPFWMFLYLLVFIFLVEVAVFYLLHSLWPQYIALNEEVFFLAGGISIYYALSGATDY